MKGIDLNSPIGYLHSSMRYFNPGEYHVDRHCEQNVLLLVRSGVLRFTEDNIRYEVSPGEYFVQHAGGEQRGEVPSDSPEYLYIHFTADWSDTGKLLPKRGMFVMSALSDLMAEIDRLSQTDSLMVEKAAVMYRIFACLAKFPRKRSLAAEIAEYISENVETGISLDALSDRFHFSPNHIIRLMKREYGMTPFSWLDSERLRRAEYLLEATSLSAADVAVKSGYRDYPYFYRCFVKKNGISPTKWRKRIRTD